MRAEGAETLRAAVRLRTPPRESNGDLLRASGMDSNDSLQALREAARHASEEGPAPADR